MVAIPDVDIAEGTLPPVRFGDFVRLYDTANARGNFDAMLTAFALDTSSNIFRYVRTAAHVIRSGGLWANFGPWPCACLVVEIGRASCRERV